MLDRSSTVIDHQKMRLRGSVIRILSLVDPFNMSDSVGGLYWGIIGVFRSLENDCVHINIWYVFDSWKRRFNDMVTVNIGFRGDFDDIKRCGGCASESGFNGKENIKRSEQRSEIGLVGKGNNDVGVWVRRLPKVFSRRRQSSVARDRGD